LSLYCTLSLLAPAPPEFYALSLHTLFRSQGVPASVEMDERDPECIHVLAFVGGEAVATGRLDVAKHGKIGRVAVLARARGIGVRSEEHTSELQSRENLVCRLLLEKKKSRQ